MVSCDCWPRRRAFLRSASAFAVTLPTFAASAPTEFADEPKESDTIVGPKKGFSPQIGTLTSMMLFTRAQGLCRQKACPRGNSISSSTAKLNGLVKLRRYLPDCFRNPLHATLSPPL